MTILLGTFPKVKRYTLGQKLDDNTLEVLELLYSIPLSQDRLPILTEISIKLDVLRMLLRLSKDTQALSDKNYISLQQELSEIGRMLGGWIRSTKQNLPQE